MKLNKKILQAKSNKQAMENIERFDSCMLELLTNDSFLENEELTIMDFTTLADIYKVPYKFKLYTSVRTYEFDENCILYKELDDLYYNLTCRRLNSYKLTLSELTAKFNEIHILIAVI